MNVALSPAPQHTIDLTPAEAIEVAYAAGALSDDAARALANSRDVNDSAIASKAALRNAASLLFSLAARPGVLNLGQSRTHATTYACAALVLLRVARSY